MARVSDDAVAEKTGRTYAEWNKLLDRAGAADWTHAARAAWLVARGVDAWWAQTVTVEFERARGLRAVGQRMDGHYEASVQRTLGMGAAAIEHTLRAKGSDLDPALGTEPRASDTNAGRVLRFATEAARVEVTLTPKDDGRCVVRVVEGNLAGVDAREAAKARWKRVLDQLVALAAE